MKDVIYGVISYSESYHSSKNCDVLKKMAKTSKFTLDEYPNAVVAFDRGHIRPCKYCIGDDVISIDNNGSSFCMYLSPTQFDVLNTIIKISERKGAGASLREIAKLRGKSHVSSYLVGKSLIRHGLLRKSYRSIASVRASPKSLEPTALAYKVVSEYKKQHSK
jgi:hypothetical protein